MERQRKKGKKRGLLLYCFVFIPYILIVLLLFRQWMFINHICLGLPSLGGNWKGALFSHRLFEILPGEMESAEVYVFRDCEKTRHGQADPDQVAEALSSLRYYWWGELKSDIIPDKPGNPPWSQLEISVYPFSTPLACWGDRFYYGRNYVKFGIGVWWPNGKFIDMMSVKFYCSPEEIARLDAICREACGLGLED